MDILEGLNPAQREAVEAIEGPVLIVAGPGSGKTRVIAHRIAYLVKVCGISPYRILAVTFTNKAARELKERVHRLLAHSAQDLTMGTFHAICARLLRIEAQHAGLDKDFLIYDDDDQASQIKRAMLELQIDPKRYPPQSIRSVISSAKAKLLTPAEFARTKSSYFDELVLRVYERYEAFLTRSKALDFDDLLLKTVKLLQENKQVQEKYQDRYLHVMIDEFQDTNLTQYTLARLLAGKYKNLCVVGDPDQSIYSWRHADIRNILNFERDFPKAKTVYLEQNYRSTKTILEAADHLISANKHRKAKDLWTENQQGSPISIVEAYDEKEEAAFVVGEVDRLVKTAKYKPGDCAVLYRTNAQSRALEEEFLRYGMKYRLVGGTRFYERREVKDVLAYMRLLQNPQDDVSLLRVINVPLRGIGQRTIDELSRWAKGLNLPIYDTLQLLSNDKGEGPSTAPAFKPGTTQALGKFLELLKGLEAKSHQLSVPDLFDEVVKATGYRHHLLESNHQDGGDTGEDRWENILELRTVAKEYDSLEPREGLAQFLQSVSLVSDVDSLEERSESTVLITLHQAKGLEFPVVFITGMEEGVLPHIRSFDDPQQMEEERRLCYVGITRAKERLYLLRAFRRSYLGNRAVNPPSQFLADIPTKLIKAPEQRKPLKEAQYEWKPARLAPVKPQPAIPARFKAGDIVKHGVFGDGVVVSCVPTTNDYEITVAFKGTAGVKKLLLSFAPLQKA